MIRTQTGLPEKAASHKSEGAVTGTEEQEKGPVFIRTYERYLLKTSVPPRTTR